MSRWRDQPNAVAFLLAGIVVALGIIALLWHAGLSVAGLIVMLLIFAGVSTLLRKPTPARRFWAALLLPATILLLFLPRGTREGMATLERREREPEES